jgi:competence protein ComEC
MGKGVAMMSAVAHWTASLPGAASVLPAWPTMALLLVVAGGLWIALWRKGWRWFGLITIAAGIVVALLAQSPDILVGRDGLTVAVRVRDGKLDFVIPPKDTFAAEAWLKRDGDERTPEQAIATPQDGVACDASGCIAKTKAGARVAISLRADSLNEDCIRAQIVISAVPAHKGCVGPKLIVDRIDVRRDGAHAVWASGGALRVTTVQNERGDRPWSQPPRAFVRQRDQ